MAQEPTLTPQMQQQLANLQAMNQQYQAAAQQRSQFEVMKAEAQQAIEALESLPDDAPVYRSVGALLMKEAGKAEALKRLKEDLETLEIRVTRITKQEAAVKASMTDLQKKLQAALGPKA